MDDHGRSERYRRLLLFPATCAAIIVFDGFWKMFALLLVLIFASFLIILEFFHPELIIPYASIHKGIRMFRFPLSLSAGQWQHDLYNLSGVSSRTRH